MIGFVFTAIASAFLIFYGLCLAAGWPVNVVKGIGLLERRSRGLRVTIGVLMMAAGVLVLVIEAKGVIGS
ncbi:MAG: hypothetical protein BIFFINMI_03195 [Phycisphaerae bacterium]|nr:hypothetical protein [Phycisphaerae bacterium]